MDTITLILIIIAILVLGIAFLRGRELPLLGIKTAAQTLWRNFPLLMISFLIAGVVQVIIPKELITNWIGSQAGIKGVFISSLVGGLVPGPPHAVFPVVGALYKSGASLGAVVSFVSAWSLWSIARLPVEMALIDPKAALVRYAITFIVPPLAGLGAQMIARYI